MCHGYAIKKKYKYRYYTCLNAIKRSREECPTKSISASIIEEKCLEIVRHRTGNERLKPASWESMSVDEQLAVFKSIVREIKYNGETRKLTLQLHNNDTALEYDIPLTELKRKNTDTPFTSEPPIRRQLLLAHQIQSMLDNEKAKGLDQISEWTNINIYRLYQVMNLLYLAPRIQEDILLSDSPLLEKLSERTIRHIANEPYWEKQITHWDHIIAPFF
jgi:hypothetical protein